MVRRLLRACVNQIEGIAVEHRARDGDRVEGFARRMGAAERRQCRIVERLHAERNAIDAGRAIAAKPFRLDAGWIGLKRDLGIGCDLPTARNRVDDGADGLRSHQ